jgi:SET domain-containing protein
MCQPADRLSGAPRDRTYVAASTLHGRGVFAAVPIAAGEVVEECPVLRFPAAQREHIDATLIDEYYFDWDGDGAIALGMGSLYNHSDAPVAEYIKDTANDVLVVRALSAIAEGEEITFHYSGPAH